MRNPGALCFFRVRNMGNRKHKGRAARNPTIEQAKIKEQIDTLAAPTEQLKRMLVEQQLTNENLHKTNKVLTQTLKEMLGEFHDRLSAVELEQFGEVRGDFNKYLAKEEEDVQLSDVRGDDAVASDTTPAGEDAGDRGQGDAADAPGSTGGDTTLH